MTDKEVSKKAEKTVSQLKMLGIGLQVKRNELGWSIAEVARRSDIHYSYISRVEKGLIWPGAEILQKILNVMGVAIELVGGVPFVKVQDLGAASPADGSLPDGKGLEQTISKAAATPALIEKMNKEQRARAIAGKSIVALNDAAPIGIMDGIIADMGIPKHLNGAPEQKNLNELPAKGWSPDKLIRNPAPDKKKAAPVITGFKGDLKR